jgi:nucleotide sugar dehydrogenase
MPDIIGVLKEKIEDKSASISVIGLGYVGLPLAVAFAKRGYLVIGLDVDGEKIAAIERGESYILDVAGEEVALLVREGRLKATTDYDILKEVDVIFICVPTPFDEMKAPDLSFIVAASEGISTRLKEGQLIILQSTTYPGTTEEVVLPILEKSGLKAGLDFHLAFSPERVNPGDKVHTVENTPKVLGGITPACAELARYLLSKLTPDIYIVSSTRVAEMTKLLENIYRSVNIALVNELAILCERMGIDIWEVIEAAKTKPFGFMPFYPGPGVGGHCLAEDEYIFVKEKGELIVTKIGEYFSKARRNAIEQKYMGTTLLKLEGVEILSFNPLNGGVCYKPLLYMSKRRYDGKMLRIVTDDGRHLTVTDGHPMLVWEGGRSIIKRAFDIQPGDQLIVLIQMPETEEQVLTIDLISYLSEEEIARVRVSPKTEKFSAYKDELTPHLRYKHKYYWDIYRYNCMPLSLYLELERLEIMPIPRSDLYLRTGRGSSWNIIPAVLSVNEDFVRLLGYYLSEGCISETKSLCTRFSFNRDEQGYITDLKRILEKIGIRYSSYRDRKWNSHYIKVSSYLFSKLVKDVLGCGTDSYEMRVPGFLLLAAKPLRVSLLTGLLRGDGDVYHEQGERTYVKNNKIYTHHINTAEVGFFSASAVLFQQVVILLQGMGFVPTFKKNKPRLCLYGAEQLDKLTPLFIGEKRAKLERYKQGRRKRMPNKKFINYGSFVTVRVQEVSKAKGNDIVYSIEVKDTHTFVTSYGIVVHNCIPVDPYYLSWKAREYDFYTKFIELAAEVNQDMPYHVVEKISEGLNSQGKSLRGAKVLILGVAFKRDVDDARNSPAQRVIELLLSKGAEVSYNDPYVPSFKVGDNVFYSKGLKLESVDLTEEIIKGKDCVVIVAGHSLYDYDWIVRHASLVVDTVNATKSVREGREKILRIGAPNTPHASRDT